MNNEGKVAIFNPDTEDFVVKYDINNDKSPQEFVVRAGEISWWEPFLAKHIKKALADHLFNKRGFLKEAHGNSELAYKKYMEEIEVKL